jgi:hypothetical protein
MSAQQSMPWALDLMAFHPRLYISLRPVAKQSLPGYYSSLGTSLHQAYILRIYESCTRSKTVPLFRSVVQLYTPACQYGEIYAFLSGFILPLLLRSQPAYGKRSKKRASYRRSSRDYSDRRFGHYKLWYSYHLVAVGLSYRRTN